MKVSGFLVVLSLYELLFPSMAMAGLKLLSMKTTETFFHRPLLKYSGLTFSPCTEAPTDIVFSCTGKISC